MMERSNMAFSSRHGAAHKAVTLDLMLRTFMNSQDFQPHNPRMWEGIARLVPGTTPQQCIQRWEELRCSSRQINRDFSVLSAKGKPLSAYHDHVNSNSGHTTRSTVSLKAHHGGEQYQFMSSSAAELPPIASPDNRPSTGRQSMFDQYRGSMSRYGLQSGHSGQFTASFCQSHLYGSSRKREEEEDEELSVNCEEVNEDSQDVDDARDSADLSGFSTPTVNATLSTNLLSSSSVHKSDCSQDALLIHVRDEAKKISKDFKCSRNVLIREMRYFDDYLSSSESRQWEEVDISVHCDVSVFNWLMTYAKRGLKEGPTGEPLTQPLEPPCLQPSNAVSILISSNFLKMDSLVEKCIQYCCENISDVVGSPCNMGCIEDQLLVRMAQKFTPLEIEKINDPKDKIKNKLYLYMLERLFSPTYSHPQSPVNGSTLYRCKHCGCLLTMEQQEVFPCAIQRLKVDRSGGLIHKHERDGSWDVNQHIAGLRQKGSTWREVFWSIWGVVNWFYCTECGEPFQCKSFKKCAYHPGTLEKTEMGASRGCFSCCKKSVSSFSPLLKVESGCCVKDHVMEISDDNRTVINVLSVMRNLVCTNGEETDRSLIDQHQVSMTSLLSSGGKAKSTQETVTHNSKQATSLQHSRQKAFAIRPNSTSTTRQSAHDPQMNDETKQVRSKFTTSSMLKKHTKMRRAILEEEGSSSDESTSSSSELEEDEETSRKKVRIAQQKKSIALRKTKVVYRSRSTERSLPEWEWDCSKSVRWNQDMQRTDDEKKLTSIKQQLRQLALNDRNAKVSSTRGGDPYTGGIFCRIEAQFRVQRMMANGLPTGSSKLSSQSGYRILRKNYSSGK